ncbi:MAG TPA: thioredoxin family protein, partial [Terriglobales bacterium]
MAETPSTMLPLSTSAPDFNLSDPSGKITSLAEFKNAPALLVAFICNHCPFVKHIRKEFAAFAKEYQARGVDIIAVSSNDATNYPQDGPEKMAEESKQAGYTFPYLYDETQEVAKAYRAACT